MFGYKRMVIAQHERGLLFEERSFRRLLEPGVYRFFDPLNRVAVERYDLSTPEFQHALSDFLRKDYPELCAQHFQVVELNEQQAGLLYKNDRLSGILPPGSRRLYWRGPVEVRVETVDIAADARIPERLAVLLLKTRLIELNREVAASVYACEVADHQTGLLLVNGELREMLKPGVYAFWTFRQTVAVELVDKRLQALEVAGQEILTKDKVSLRINLSAGYTVADPVLARQGLPNTRDFLYRELQFALRQAVGTRTLDELLGDKSGLDESVFEQVRSRATVHGLVMHSVGIKDVILPGDMKEILNQVVEAEKAAQANVIKRREETAATRSLLNTAKLLEDNPTLLRLKELETLEKVSAKIERLTVFGGLDTVLRDLVSFKSVTSA